MQKKKVAILIILPIIGLSLFSVKYYSNTREQERASAVYNTNMFIDETWVSVFDQIETSFRCNLINDGPLPVKFTNLKIQVLEGGRKLFEKELNDIILEGKSRNYTRQTVNIEVSEENFRTYFLNAENLHADTGNIISSIKVRFIGSVHAFEKIRNCVDLSTFTIDEPVFYQDSDNDFIRDDIEKFIYKTNRLAIDSDGGGVDDFNEIYTYESDPTDPSDDNRILIVDSEYFPRHWELNDGGVTGYSLDKYTKVSMRDPCFQQFADKMVILWKDDNVYGKKGIVNIDGEPLFKEWNLTKDGVTNPSYFFSIENDRTGVCLDSAIANIPIYLLNDYDVVYVESPDVGYGHAWLEVSKDSLDYVADYSYLYPKESFYDETGWDDLISNRNIIDIR